MLKFTLKPGDGGVDKIFRCVKKVFDIFNVQGVKKEVFKDDVRSSKGVERCFNGVIGVLTILGLQPRFGLKPLKVLVVCAQSGNAVYLVPGKGQEELETCRRGVPRVKWVKRGATCVPCVGGILKKVVEMCSWFLRLLK